VNDVEHIHILSSGEHINDTFKVSYGKFDLTKVRIIVESGIYGKLDSDRNKGINNAIDEVKKICSLMNKDCDVKLIDKISINDIRDAVLEIVNEFPVSSQYYFNITGGTKVLSNGLFLMAIWLNGTIYHVGEDGVFQKLIVPKMHAEHVEKNPNYTTILDILYNYKIKTGKFLMKKNDKLGKDVNMLQKDLYKKMKLKYVRIRVQDKKNKRTLQYGTLSKWLQDLNEWDLIKINNPEDNRKLKNVEITEDGIFTLKFIQAMEKKNK
jgi:hypothetical protein